MDVIRSCTHAGAAASGVRRYGEGPEAEQIFLYRLVPGYMSQSFGLYCAQMAEIPFDIIERAGQIISHQQVKPLENSLKSHYSI